MEQLTKNQAVATSQEAVQNQNEPQLRDENAHNDKSVHGVLNPTYQAGLRRDAVQPDIEAERKKRDEIEAGKSYCSRRFGGATCDDKSAQIYARSLILHLGNLFLIVQLHFSKLFLILKSGVNHTSRGSISTSTLPSIKLRKCSSKIITSILSFISGRLATKSNQIKQLIRNGRSASLQRTFKKSFTSFSHSTRNKTRDGLIRVRNIRALNGRFNTSITHAYSIVIGSKHITLNATGGGFLTASKQFRHGATSKSRSNTASNSTKHKSPHLSGWRQIISLIT